MAQKKTQPFEPTEADLLRQLRDMPESELAKIPVPAIPDAVRSGEAFRQASSLPQQQVQQAGLVQNTPAVAAESQQQPQQAQAAPPPPPIQQPVQQAQATTTDSSNETNRLLRELIEAVKQTPQETADLLLAD